MTLNREVVKQAFRECKKVAGLDFSYSRGISDCMTCTNYDIAVKHSNEAKGIWLKWFAVGMNKSRWGEYKTYHICHTLTAKQAKIVGEVLSKYFNFSWSGERCDCMEISAKEAA